MNTEELKDGQIITDERGDTWLYLYGVFSSYEPDREKRAKLFERGLKENIRNLYNIAKILS